MADVRIVHLDGSVSTREVEYSCAEELFDEFFGGKRVTNEFDLAVDKYALLHVDTITSMDEPAIGEDAVDERVVINPEGFTLKMPVVVVHSLHLPVVARTTTVAGAGSVTSAPGGGLAR